MTVLELSDRYFADISRRRARIVTAATFGYAALWLLFRVRYVWDVSGLPERRFAPVGVLAGLDGPPERWTVMLVWLLGTIACATAAAGRLSRVAAPVGAVAMLLIATLTSSYSQIFHTEHLVVIHLLVLAAATVSEPPGDATTSGWPLRLMMASTAVVYVVAGVAKLRYGGLDWVTGDVLRGHIAADNLRKLLLDDWYSPLGGWMAGVSWIWPPIAVLTMIVELGAPLALIPGRIRYTWVAVAWAFHVGVLVLMAISFPYQLLGVAYLSFLPVERIEAHLRDHLLRRRSRTIADTGAAVS